MWRQFEYVKVDGVWYEVLDRDRHTVSVWLPNGRTMKVEKMAVKGVQTFITKGAEVCPLSVKQA